MKKDKSPPAKLGREREQSRGDRKKRKEGKETFGWQHLVLRKGRHRKRRRKRKNNRRKKRRKDTTPNRHFTTRLPPQSSLANFPDFIQKTNHGVVLGLMIFVSDGNDAHLKVIGAGKEFREVLASTNT